MIHKYPAEHWHALSLGLSPLRVIYDVEGPGYPSETLLGTQEQGATELWRLAHWATGAGSVGPLAGQFLTEYVWTAV